MPTRFHVTSSENRESIERYGLDSGRMGRMSGVAGSSRPEVEGVFLCRDRNEVDFFCGMNANDGPVDVWAVDGVPDSDLVESSEGFLYLPRPIPAAQLSLLEASRLPDPPVDSPSAPSTAYQSSLTLTVDDGRALREAEAPEWLRQRSRRPESPSGSA